MKGSHLVCTVLFKNPIATTAKAKKKIAPKDNFVLLSVATSRLFFEYKVCVSYPSMKLIGTTLRLKESSRRLKHLSSRNKLLHIPTNVAKWKTSTCLLPSQHLKRVSLNWWRKAPVSQRLNPVQDLSNSISPQQVVPSSRFKVPSGGRYGYT